MGQKNRKSGKNKWKVEEGEREESRRGGREQVDGWKAEEREAGRRKYKRMEGERESATVRKEDGRDKLGK